MISYARLTPGRGWRPFRALLYYTYRIGAASPLARTITRGIAATISVRHPAADGLKDDALLAQLRRDGYAIVPPLLSDAQIEEMLAFLAQRQPVGNASFGNYGLADVIHCPQVMELANHPRLLSIAAAYLGCAPTISTIGLRWSYPSERKASVQSFHRDPDDWKMVKFFTYLTDVSDGTGPHVFVAGSHREKSSFFAGRYSDEEVARRYGDQALVTIDGPRGTMFLADTAGVHKGAPAVDGPRLLFEVGYTLLPCYAMEYRPEPVGEPLSGHDRYINRLIVRPAAGAA
jgi:hypothetical protein